MALKDLRKDLNDHKLQQNRAKMHKISYFAGGKGKSVLYFLKEKPSQNNFSF